jgi:Zn-finger nucleic acid-binding protein
MKCPVCQIDLNVTEQSGQEVAYCPQCDVNWIGQEDFEITLHGPKFGNGDWNPDELEPDHRRGAANRNGCV